MEKVKENIIKELTKEKMNMQQKLAVLGNIVKEVIKESIHKQG